VAKLLRDDDLIGIIGTQESQYLLKASEIAEGVLARLKGQGSYAGAKLPWTRTHTYLRFRPGEVTVWGGINGHGKSLLL
jgi:twinkle protein